MVVSHGPIGMAAEHQLLDVTDRTRRIVQHGAVFAGVIVLVLARAVANRPGGLGLVVWMIVGGLALFVLAAAVKQQWFVTYKGHDVRFENNPLRGERLFIDGKVAGKGKIGYRSEIRAVIAAGDGAGETVIARTEAGLLRFRCRLTVQVAEAPQLMRA